MRFHLENELLLLFHSVTMAPKVLFSLKSFKIKKFECKFEILTLERLNHLKLLLCHMIPILIRQNIKFKFFLITQTPNGKFNRGKLLNAGFEEVTKQKARAPWTTTVFTSNLSTRFCMESLINNLIVLYFTMLT